MRTNASRFVSFTSGDALDHVVPVGKQNEHVDYLNDLINEGTLTHLDPINQLIMLEEMDEHEALMLVTDLYRKLKGKPQS